MPNQHNCAVVCKFMRDKDSDWENGIAIILSPGLRSVVAIIPADATSPVDVLQNVWRYDLLPMYGSFVPPDEY